MAEEITAEEIAQHYRAAMDSVNLINEIVASGDTDEDDLVLNLQNGSTVTLKARVTGDRGWYKHSGGNTANHTNSNNNT